MISFYDFEKQWKAITPQKGGYLKLDLEHPLDLRVGYYNDKTRSFVIIDAPEYVTKLPSSKVVLATVQQLQSNVKALELRLLDLEYEDVYLRFCWDLIDNSNKPVDQWQSLIQRYSKWHKMFENASGDGKMSFSRQKGLLGELLYFRKLQESYSNDEVISFWKGPEGYDQDFQMGNTWVEVKTVSLAASTVRISSLEQLRQDVEGTLVVFVLEQSSAGKKLVNLVDTVNSIKKSLNLDVLSLSRFEAKLSLLGYKQADEGKYRKNTFRIVEEREYAVKTDFPKLTKESVPIEVETASYSLSFSGIEKFRR